MSQGRLVENLAERAAVLLGGTLKHAVAVTGGDLSKVVAIELDDGRTGVVKTGPAIRVEADMLDAIRATGAPAPAVLAQDDDALVLERLPADGRLSDAWRSLGHALVQLHGTDGNVPASRARKPYGWRADYAFGPVAIENAWSDDWTDFWAQRRLVNQLEYLPPSLARRIERLVADLTNRLPAHPPPALLHGDLWGGNVLVSQGSVSGLVDPACYYGDREVDFAMLGLFNHPEAELFDACEPLAAGHVERLPIYQLWPALVHLRLFGAGYQPMVERMLGAAGV